MPYILILKKNCCLIGKVLDLDLKLLTKRQIRLANDADCFTKSEATDGAGKPYRTVFGVIIGTGCGGGITVDRKLISGPNAIAGEWGHNPLPWPQTLDGISEWPGPNCYCGKMGCIAAQYSEKIYLTADNSRSEATLDIIDEIKETIQMWTYKDQSGV